VARLQLVEPGGEPLVTTSHRPIRLLLARQLVFPADDSATDLRPTSSPRSPAWGVRGVSVARWIGLRNSTPRASGSSAASLAHSSASSFPGTPLWAGHHRISTVMFGLADRGVAICSLAWIAYFCPGPGSSDAMRLMAAWASMKIVTLSGGIAAWLDPISQRRPLYTRPRIPPPRCRLTTCP